MAMTMSGEYQLPVARETVWEKLNDAETLKACIPGCEQLDKLSDTEFQAVATTKIGPVKAKFKGKVTLSDLDPPNGYKISGQGDGGVAGFAKGGATVKLTEKDGGTLLSYEVEAQIGGKLAQLGQRLINGAAKKMADDFFQEIRSNGSCCPCRLTACRYCPPLAARRWRDISLTGGRRGVQSNSSSRVKSGKIAEFLPGMWLAAASRSAKQDVFRGIRGGAYGSRFPHCER